MAIKAVLFDLGGTLLYYHDELSTDPQRPFRRITQLGVQALHEQLSDNGFDLPALDDFRPVVDRHIGAAYLESVQNLRGGSVEPPLRAAFSEVGVSLDDPQWAEVRHLFYVEIDNVVRPRKGLLPTFPSLQEAGYTLGLISNTFWAADVHDSHMNRYGIIDFFPVRVYSCDSPYIKPHPAIFTGMLDRLGVSPGEAVYVGDRADVDVAGAQGAGLKGILIESPYRHEGLGDVVPDAIIGELPDLIPALQRLQGDL